MNKVILYYNFSPIVDVPHFWLEQKLLCARLKLKGRVYISSEGINGTLAGASQNIEEYKRILCAFQGFADTEFKEDACKEIPFYKLAVTVRPEIVTLKTPLSGHPKKDGGHFLSPYQWRQMLESKEDFLLLDVRNDYESRIGHFEGAVTPNVKNFYDFPQWLEGTGFDKGKKVLMYCTGGIRCEKFSVLMKEKGFQDVYQLRGGIINYAKEERGAHFKGKCFVFDDRLAVAVNPESKEAISRCEISDVPCDTYINCANPECNRLFLCAEEAAVKIQGCCSKECRESPLKRPFDAKKIYEPYRKWYHYGPSYKKSLRKEGPH